MLSRLLQMRKLQRKSHWPILSKKTQSIGQSPLQNKMKRPQSDQILIKECKSIRQSLPQNQMRLQSHQILIKEYQIGQSQKPDQKQQIIVMTEKSSEKCRCCRRKFRKQEKQIRCTDSQRERFKELTGMTLRLFPGLSDNICGLCDVQLLNFSRIKKDFIEKQTMFYNTMEAWKKLGDSLEVMDPLSDPTELDIEQIDIKEERADSGTAVIIKQEEKAKIIEESRDYSERDSEITVSQVVFEESSQDEQNNIEEEPPLQSPPLQSPPTTEPICRANLRRQCVISMQNKELDRRLKLKSLPKKLTLLTECPHCSRLVPNLRAHRNIAHSLDWRYKCDLCRHSSYSSECISRHMQSHTGASQFGLKSVERTRNGRYKKKLCVECGELVTSLKTHHHGKPNHEEMKFKCDVCGHRANYINYMTDHMERIHLKLRNVECELCDKKFFGPTEYRRHFKAKHGKKEHVCITCDKAYGSRTLWKNHMQAIHFDSRRFVCEFCSKGFRKSEHLRFHCNAHLNNAEFACKICPKAFFRPRELLRHFCANSEEKFCGVDGCDAKFRRDDYQVKHIRGHSDISEETKEILIKQARSSWSAQRQSRKALYKFDNIKFW